MLNRSPFSFSPATRVKIAALSELFVDVVQHLVHDVATSRASEVGGDPQSVVVDRHSAPSLGLSGRRFLRLAREGAFPSHIADGRGRVCAFVQDVVKYLESQQREPVPQRTSGLPNVDELIAQQLENGRLRVVAGGAKSRGKKA